MRVILAVLVLVCGLAAPAEAVSLRDLINLSKQGVSDDILIALVEAEQSVFDIRATDLKPLKDAGLSDRLVVHLIHTRSRPAPEIKLHLASAQSVARQPQAEPRVVYVDRVETVVETVVVPVYVPVPSHTRHETRRDDDGPGRVDDDRHERRKPAEPVYWGYGGKLRPDAWKPAGGKKDR